MWLSAGKRWMIWSVMTGKATDFASERKDLKSFDFGSFFGFNISQTFHKSFYNNR